MDGMFLLDTCCAAGCSPPNRIFSALLDARDATECLRHNWMISVRRDVLAGYLLRGSMLVTQPNVTSVAGYSADNGMFAALLDNRRATKGLPHDWMIGVRRNILAGYVLRC